VAHLLALKNRTPFRSNQTIAASDTSTRQALETVLTIEPTEHTVRLTNTEMEALGVDRNAKSRALKQLQKERTDQHPTGSWQDLDRHNNP
jgi:hypothetical protein